MKRKTDNFNKFFNKRSNSAVKEQIKQEKKAEKKARRESIERHFEEKRKGRELKSGSPGSAVGGRKPDVAANLVLRSPGRSEDFSPQPSSLIPLNKYLSHSGVCSRRDAAELIKQGKVSVNGSVVSEPGTKVSASDLVKVSGKKITISKNFVYILLNKPKDYITTTDDPLGRRTVLDLIKHATQERVYPVGRLDRNTSGVLLLTNDGDLAQKLAHPKHEIKKIYHVVLDKSLSKNDLDDIAAGIVLDDGVANVDAVAYADAKDKTQIGIEIHSGRNRIVRRIFEQLGYDVKGLDRVMYAGLTKKNVQRGKWRLLQEKEVRVLKYLNSSIK
ncbi:MAG TPA: pseudouridine synthase [Puia sp.]|jgi:23S rRNA pseudouridine2605 synthase|nr:pseudouridine synthase [Puia sp.]